ncbi:MAG: tetratricopeptide repeat protein, partial [Kiritimatiellaceae bacterium]|nr:tetratricopeptide repeat protein [Kiritimatiellaceae bacterium]
QKPTAEPVKEKAPAEEPEVVVTNPIPEVPPVVRTTAAKEPPPKKKPTSPAEAKKIQHEELEQAEVKEVLNFINKYVKPTGVVVAVICIFVLANSFVKGTRQKTEAKADAALMDAKTAADYQAIMDNYSKTPSAPLALLGLAQEKFNTGDVAGAEGLYADFMGKYAKHEMAAQAEFNRITCKEAQGKYADAGKLYGDFKNNHPDSHLAPVALLSKARCLEATHNFTDAKVVYENVITFYPQSGWSQTAEANLRVVESKIK